MQHKPFSIHITGRGLIGGERSDIDADRLTQTFVRTLESAGHHITHASLHSGTNTTQIVGKAVNHPAVGEGGLGAVLNEVRGLRDLILEISGKTTAPAAKGKRGKGKAKAEEAADEKSEEDEPQEESESGPKDAELGNEGDEGPAET